MSISEKEFKKNKGKSYTWEKAVDPKTGKAIIDPRTGKPLKWQVKL